MLEWLFGFRGEIGRARFMAGLSLLFFGCLVLAVVTALAGINLHWPEETWTLATALAIFALSLWSITALSARRLRDLGAPPILILGGLTVICIVEAMWSPVALPLPWNDTLQRPITTLIAIVAGLSLAALPGRTAGEERPGGVSVALLSVGAIAGLLAAIIGLGTVFDPLQKSACPLYGPGAPQDDCASRGVIGRYYSSDLIVRANRQLDQHDPAGALKLADKALALRPDFVFAFNSRGLAYDQLNDPTRALQAYDQALARKPTYVHGLINRAALLDRLGHRDRALADLRTILRVQPDNAVAKAGIAYMTKGGR